MTYLHLWAYTGTGVSHSRNRKKNRKRFWKNAGEWTGRVEISMEEIAGSKRVKNADITLKELILPHYDSCVLHSPSVTKFLFAVKMPSWDLRFQTVSSETTHLNRLREKAHLKGFSKAITPYPLPDQGGQEPSFNSTNRSFPHFLINVLLTVLKREQGEKYRLVWWPSCCVWTCGLV